MAKLKETQFYGKLEGNTILTNKANLLVTMQKYYRNHKDGVDPMGTILPVTVNIETTHNMNENT